MFDGSTFELRRTGSTNRFRLADQTFSWSGGLADGSGITVRIPFTPGDRYGAHVEGHTVPPAEFVGLEYGGRPSLANPNLVLAGETAEVRRRVFALTKRTRALHIRVAGRAYTYRARGTQRRRGLSREGVDIDLTRSRARNPDRIVGTCRGPADLTDIALAALLEGVYTRNLTPTGALLSLPGRFIRRLD